MATPGKPGNLVVKSGPHPGSIVVNADTVSASPTVTSYTVYVNGITGVDKTTFIFKRDLLTKPHLVILGLPDLPAYFVTITAINSEAEGAIQTEVKYILRR